jgi:hypothetical protein
MSYTFSEEQVVDMEVVVVWKWRLLEVVIPLRV